MTDVAGMTQVDLETRKNLPQHLRKLLDKFPRINWHSHKNFGELTRFWLSRHIMFRELIGRMQQSSKNIIEPQDQQEAKSNIRHLTGFFLQQLHAHHTIEDQQFFPLLIPMDSDLKHGFEILDADHHVLDKQIDLLAGETNHLLSVLKSDKDPRAAADAVLNTQIKFEKFLNQHLVDEEELIVPILLEYGPPDLV
ncbi:MAG: hemerythrin domain-containing protein [Rhizobiaceae bacterium]|nr:hemerythrin domain-containing protein [Rhizobiaceae bacterium]